MPRIAFLPPGVSIDVDPNTKILVAARTAKVDIRFACASCRCGSCAVRIPKGDVTPMKEDEQKLLTRLKLPTDGSIRLACQCRAQGDTEVDLSFQDEYDSDIGFEED